MPVPPGIVVSGKASSCLAGSRKPRLRAARGRLTVAFWPVPPSLTRWSTQATVARRSLPSAAVMCVAALTLPSSWTAPEALGAAVPEPRLDRAVAIPGGEHVADGVDRDRDRADVARSSEIRCVAAGAARAALADEVDRADRRRRRRC